MKQPHAKLSLEALTKRFHLNVAVSDVSFNAYSGEIVALVGSNGSGKSTLMKMIYGTVIPDSGFAKLNDLILKQGNLSDSRARGVEMVFQDKDEESKLCPRISVAENLFLGREPLSWSGMIKSQQMLKQISELEVKHKISLPPLEALFGQLSGGQQKAVAIGRALLSNPEVLLLDEPTSSLGFTERSLVQRAIGGLKLLGKVVILCSHSLEEVLLLADRIIALRAGKLIADERRSSVSEKDVALLMSR